MPLQPNEVQSSRNSSERKLSKQKKLTNKQIKRFKNLFCHSIISNLDPNNNNSTSSSLASSPVSECVPTLSTKEQNSNENSLFVIHHEYNHHPQSSNEQSSTFSLLSEKTEPPPIEEDDHSQDNFHIFNDSTSNILDRQKHQHQDNLTEFNNGSEINDNNNSLSIVNHSNKKTPQISNTQQHSQSKNNFKPRSWNIRLQISEPSGTNKTPIQIMKKAFSTQSVPSLSKNVGQKPGVQPVKHSSSTEISPLITDNQQMLVSNQKKILSDENYEYISVEHADSSFPVFWELWKQKQVCDVVLKVGGREFPAHRIVLCATIPYFYAMFTNDLVERNQTEIELKCDLSGTPSLNVDAFESLLRYAYTGGIAINSTNVQSILIGASFLGLVNVQQACSDYLKIRLNVSNVLDVKSFAFALGCDTLVQASKRFIHRNFEEISKGPDFLNLDVDEILDVIASDELNIINEKIVFEAVIHWTKHDEEMRKQYLPQLLREVRLPLLYPEYLTDVVLSQKLVRYSLECRDLVDEAKDFHLLPHRRELICRSRTRPRSGHHIQGSIYAVGGLTKTGDSMSTVEVYDPQMKRWRMGEAMTMMRSRVGVTVMDGKLYAIGGYNGFDRLNTVEVYDSKLKQWKRVKSMHYRRSAVGAAALNGYLYVCGGYDGSISLNVVERYLAATDEWENVTPMNIKRSAAGVVALDGYIYALGGHDGLMIFNSVERYDPKTDQWEFVESMLSRRCRLGVATFGGKIYVCGGYDGCIFLQSAEVFDPQTGKWSPIAKMRMTRSRVALVANCAKLFAIGGYDGITNLSSVETYDIENNCWEMASSMVAHEGGVGVGVIPDNY